MWYFRVKLFLKSVQTCGLLDNRHGCRVKYVHPQRLVGSIETDIGGLIGRANTWISPNRIARLFGTFSTTLRKFCKSFIGLLSFHFQNPFVKPSGSFRLLNFTSFITSSNPSSLRDDDDTYTFIEVRDILGPRILPERTDLGWGDQ